MPSSPVTRSHPRRMSLDACIRRCPSTTRRPEFVYLLFPTYGLSTDAWASFAGKNRGSVPSRPVYRVIQARVPTLPTPTTFRAHAVAVRLLAQRQRLRLELDLVVAADADAGADVVGRSRPQIGMAELEDDLRLPTGNRSS